MVQISGPPRKKDCGESADVTCVQITLLEIDFGSKFLKKFPISAPSTYFVQPICLTHHGRGLLGWLGCATRRFHLGTDESDGMYSNQTENWQHSETFVLINAWRCKVEWMDGKVAKRCESIFEWDDTLLLHTHCYACYLGHLLCQHGWLGRSNVCRLSSHLAGLLGSAWGPILYCHEKPRSGSKTEGCILGTCLQEISYIIKIPHVFLQNQVLGIETSFSSQKIAEPSWSFPCQVWIRRFISFVVNWHRWPVVLWRWSIAPRGRAFASPNMPVLHVSLRLSLGAGCKFPE